MTFATYLAAPFFAVFMLRDLQLSYLTYMALQAAACHPEPNARGSKNDSPEFTLSLRRGRNDRLRLFAVLAS